MSTSTVSQPARHSGCTVAFVIPPELLTAVPTVSSLVRLPCELLLHIFSHTRDPVDQLCLALTCRRLLQVSSLLIVEIPSVAKHRYLTSGPYDDMLALLRRLAPAGARGGRRRTLALCCDCLWYRPTRKSYWRKDGDRYALVKQDIRAPVVWDKIVASWTCRFSFQCPACWLKERVEELERVAKLQRPPS